MNNNSQTTSSEVNNRKDEIADLQNTNKNLSDRLAVAKCKINDPEQHSRRDNLVITGLITTAIEVLLASDHGQFSIVT